MVGVSLKNLFVSGENASREREGGASRGHMT